MLKLPSLNIILKRLLRTVRRFPAAILVALIATCVLSYFTHNEWQEHNIQHYQALCRILMCSTLALPLFIAVTILSESRRHKVIKKTLWQMAALALIVWYYFTIGDLDKLNIVVFARYFLYALSFHLFVSFSPFLVKGQINGFWQYNKILFLRFLLAALYTVVLYGGISLALWSIDELLHFTINYKKYLYVWYLFSCIFNTVFFLGGVPENLKELNEVTDYLKGLKTFTQYVLLPLVTIYLLILYLYILEIIIKWALPKGLVSYLVIGYSVAGIFSLLLIYPIRNNYENRWIKTFSRWFYFALYPLIILLGIAIFHRISDYGITENRYFIIVLALWLFGISTYFISDNRENIKVIPISLCFLAIFTSFGPWGAFHISEHSQMNRLKEILVKDGILVKGKINGKTQHRISSNEDSQIWSVVDYLENSASLDVLQPWFDDVMIDTIKSSASSLLFKKMNIILSNKKEWNDCYYSSKNSMENGIVVKGFDMYSTFFYNSAFRYDTTADKDTISLGYFTFGHKDSFDIFPLHGTDMFVLKKGKMELVHIDFRGFLKHIDSLYNTDSNKITNEVGYDKDLSIPNDKFVLDLATDSLQFRFLFQNISTEEKSGKINFTTIEAGVLIKNK